MLKNLYQFENFQDAFVRMFPEFYVPEEMAVKNVTLVVDEDCNMNCSYCYQINKAPRHMTKEMGRKIIDMLFEERMKENRCLNSSNAQCLVLDFIGGEPFLQIDLMDYIVEYFKYKSVTLNHPWKNNWMISVSTNGTLYETPKVQEFVKKNKARLSCCITIDGDKKLHDSCRKFKGGDPTYDIVESAIKKQVKDFGSVVTKLTLAPANVEFFCDAVKNLYDIGLVHVNANCVFEEGWELKDATVLYEQMKKLSDFIIDNEIYDRFSCSIFDESIGKPMSERENGNWCFKASTPILTPNGNVMIENILVGDEVISGNGVNRKVENIVKRQCNDTAIINATGIFETYTTLDHPYLVKRFKYIGNKNVYRYSEPEWVKVKDIKNRDKIALYNHKFGEVDFNKELAYVVGRYIGDGWLSTTGYKICCGHEEYQELSEKLNEAKVNYSVDNYRTVKQFNIFKNNTELINILSQIGRNAPTKNIPGDAFKWNQESVESMLKGFFDADGYYNKNKNRQIFNTVSQTLANDVIILLRGLGYFPTCYISKRSGKSIIEGREVTIKDRYEVYYSLDANKTRYCTYDKEMNVIWTTVRSVETDCDPYDVYNLTVEEDHTYIANGSIVHNCGGTGKMLCVDPSGLVYPCLRYMEYSLGTDVPPIVIGDVESGIANKKEHQHEMDCLDCITRKSQSTDECFNCPIAYGCAWCSGYNYQKFGTPNKRATYICVMHKARVLACSYYFNKLYRHGGTEDRVKISVPREWALQIIPEEEFDMLLEMSN